MRFSELERIGNEINLAKFHATIDERSDGPGHPHVPVFRWADGTSTMIESPPHGANSVVVRQVMEGARAVAELSDASHRIMRDGRLSARGKSEDMDPIRRRTITHIAVMYATVLAFGEDLQKREAARYAPPEYTSRSVSSLDLEYRQDREVRDVLRSMSADERAALAKRITDGEFRERTLLAILRDPAQSLSWLYDVAASVWREYVDREDAEGLAHLNIDRESFAWGQRALMVLGGTALPYARFERVELAILVAETKGHGVYGLTTEEVVAALRAYRARNAA